MNFSSSTYESSSQNIPFHNAYQRMDGDKLFLKMVSTNKKKNTMINIHLVRHGHDKGSMWARVHAQLLQRWREQVQSFLIIMHYHAGFHHCFLYRRYYGFPVSHTLFIWVLSLLKVVLWLMHLHRPPKLSSKGVPWCSQIHWHSSRHILPFPYGPSYHLGVHVVDVTVLFSRRTKQRKQIEIQCARMNSKMKQVDNDIDNIVVK